MAQSAFSDIPTPRVSDISLTARPDVRQLDPNYDSYDALIKAGQGEFEKPKSKLQIKADALAKKLDDKKKNNTGEEPEPYKGDGNLLKLFASSLTTNVAGIADTALELGVRGLDKGAEFLGSEDFIKDDTVEAVSSFADPLTNQQNVDEFLEYDRSGYQSKLESIKKDVHEGNYLNAFGTALITAPEALAESMGFMIPLMAGSSLKGIKLAGKAAAARSASFGGSKAMQITASNAAIKAARADLGVLKSIANLGKENVGLISMSAKMTKDQNEEFTKNNNNIGMTPEQMLRATAINIAFNALDRFTFKNIIKGGGAKQLKQVWGKIPAPEKSQILRKIAQLPADMTKEAAQEYVQEWSEIVNETWDTKDKANLSAVLSDSLRNEDAIVAAMLGATSGGLMSAPKTLSTTLNEVGRGKKERKDINAAISNTAAGYDTVEKKAKHQKVIDKSYESDKSFFENLTKAEEEISDINKNKDMSPTEKISAIQKKMSYRKGLSDKAENARIMAFGQEEYTQLHDSILSNKDLENDQVVQDGIELIKKNDVLRNTTKIELLQDLINNIKKVNADKNIEMDMTSIDKTITSINTSMNKTATDIIKKGDSDITYSREKFDANKRGVTTKSVSEAIAAKAEPKTEQDADYDELIKLDDDALSAKIAEYDNATIAKIMKEARQRGKQARTTEKNEMSFADVGRLKKAWTNAKRAVVPSRAKVINRTGKNTIKQRAAVQQTYDPAKSISERITQAKADVKKFFEKGTVDAKKKTTDQTEKVKKTAEQKTPNEIKNAVNVVRKAAENLSKVDDMPLLKELVTDLKDAGHLVGTKASNILDRIVKFEKEHKIDEALKDIDAESMRAAVKNEYNTLKTTLKEANKADAEKAIKAFITKMGSKLNQTEQKALAATLVSLQNAGTITASFAENTFQSIVDFIKEKPIYGPMTVEEAAAAKLEAEKDAKQTKKTLLEYYKNLKSKLKNAKRETIERDVIATSKKAKKKVGKIVREVKDSADKSETFKKISEDTGALLTVIGSAAGKVDIKAIVEQSGAFYRNLDLKKTLFELGSLDENGNKLSIVEEIVDQNGEPLVETKEEVCN